MISRIGQFGLIWILGLGAMTATSQAGSDDLRNLVEVFRSDLSTAKKEVIIAALQLTDDEAQRFWPIYREYETALAKLGDERIKVIEQYAAAHLAGTLDDRTADEITRKSFAFHRQRLDLWQEYHGKIARELSPVRAAEFLQLEHQLSLLIDLGIAAELPLVGEARKEN